MPNISIKTSITIHSSPEQVYRVVTNFDTYCDWNPWIPNASGQCVAGATILAQHKYFGALKHQLAELTPPEKLRWITSSWQRFFVNTTREIAIYPGTNGNTLYAVKLTLTGPCARLTGFFLKSVLKNRLRQEVNALKRHCEKTAPSKRNKTKPIRSMDLHNADSEAFSHHTETALLL